MTYIQPGLSIILLILIWAWRQPDVRKKNRLVLGAALFLLFWSWPPIPWLLIRTLESRYYPAQPPPPSDEAQAIIVASGGAIVTHYPVHDAWPSEDTADRIRYASWLYHHWKRLPIVVSGGPILDAPSNTSATLAQVMAERLIELGVPDSDIIQENQSTSTYENALFSARALSGRSVHTIVLVTEAFHMRRTELSYRKAGFNVIAAPCGFRGIEPPNDWAGWFPSSRGIVLSERILHEWLGLAWYKLRDHA